MADNSKTQKNKSKYYRKVYSAQEILTDAKTYGADWCIISDEKSTVTAKKGGQITYGGYVYKTVDKKGKEVYCKVVLNVEDDATIVVAMEQGDKVSVGFKFPKESDEAKAIIAIDKAQLAANKAAKIKVKKVFDVYNDLRDMPEDGKVPEGMELVEAESDDGTDKIRDPNNIYMWVNIDPSKDDPSRFLWDLDFQEVSVNDDNNPVVNTALLDGKRINMSNVVEYLTSGSHVITGIEFSQWNISKFGFARKRSFYQTVVVHRAPRTVAPKYKDTITPTKLSGLLTKKFANVPALPPPDANTDDGNGNDAASDSDIDDEATAALTALKNGSSVGKNKSSEDEQDSGSASESDDEPAAKGSQGKNVAPAKGKKAPAKGKKAVESDSESGSDSDDDPEPEAVLKGSQGKKAAPAPTKGGSQGSQGKKAAVKGK
jgi:hypothetical protein